MSKLLPISPLHLRTVTRAAARYAPIQHSINTPDCPFHTVYSRNKPDIFHPPLSPARRHRRFYSTEAPINSLLGTWQIKHVKLKPELEVERLQNGESRQTELETPLWLPELRVQWRAGAHVHVSAGAGDLANGATPRCYHAANSSHSSGHQRRPTWSLAEQSRPVSGV